MGNKVEAVGGVSGPRLVLMATQLSQELETEEVGDGDDMAAIDSAAERCGEIRTAARLLAAAGEAGWDARRHRGDPVEPLVLARARQARPQQCTYTYRPLNPG
jgi:hypothetical protein